MYTYICIYIYTQFFILCVWGGGVGSQTHYIIINIQINHEGKIQTSYLFSLVIHIYPLRFNTI